MLWYFDNHPIRQVFCRVRPLASEELDGCVEVISDTIVQLVPPTVSNILNYILTYCVVSIEFLSIQVWSQERGKEMSCYNILKLIT